ncbi:hypothetical protein BDP27DRAFT_1440543 [Rhodocollybia butyracea]|uniref:Uncharacterized protein n=1 Tax=Rhodocollybia butyracea TaxID=206335 RepID=A0A9P5P345_9AGAR|nr:hypothetical protein BDP27DRAFT_1440543 [Rhodocollybia butyracea]
MSTRPEPAYLQIRLAVLIHDWRRTQIAEKNTVARGMAKTFALLKAKYLRIIKILLKNERSFIDTDNNAKNALEAGDAFVLAHSTAAADRLKEQRLCLEREQKFHAELDAVLGLDFDSFKFDYTADDFVLSTVTDPLLSNTPSATSPANARKRSQELKRVRPSHLPPPTLPASQSSSSQYHKSGLSKFSSSTRAISLTSIVTILLRGADADTSSEFPGILFSTPVISFWDGHTALATNFQHSHFQFSKSRSENAAPAPSSDLTDLIFRWILVLSSPIALRDADADTKSTAGSFTTFAIFWVRGTLGASDSNLAFSSCETPMRITTPALGDDHFLLDVLPESYPLWHADASLRSPTRVVASL